MPAVGADIFKRTPDLRAFLLNQDVIYVGGGNTKSMLVVWRDWGLPELLREAWEKGIVLTGVSAGAICWFEQGVTDSWAGELRPFDCLGFLPGSCCPHYDGEGNRRLHTTGSWLAKKLRLEWPLRIGRASTFTARNFIALSPLTLVRKPIACAL
jgi:peptidase E